MYTTSTAFLEALQEAGVSYIFANLGSDHPAIIESLAHAKKENKKVPQLITCPHEFVAMSAAHGYAQLTGKPQVVMVHVECGTQNIGGGIHNAFKGRVPVLVFAGASPYTQENELTGSRNEFIHWIQDVFDQRGIMRGYSKYDNEIRTGKNVKQLVFRALQFAKSEPKGPVYLMGPREAMEEETEKVTLDPKLWEPISPAAIPPQEIRSLVDDLVKAKNPLIVTSYLGRNPEAVGELEKLCNRLAIPVLESVPHTMNFPTDNPMHIGYQWNVPNQNELLAEADFVLVLDSDVPWIPTKNKASDDATIYYIDVDPIKEEMPLWYIPSKRFFKADSQIALQQIYQYLGKKKIVNDAVEARWNRIKAVHDRQKEERRLLEEPSEDVITPEFLTACVREVIDEDTIVLNEGISSYQAICTHIGPKKPGTMHGSGSGSLGWNGGAAIGAKLANPDKTVVSLTGDGSYLFSNPSVVHWMAKRYDTPFLTVIYNNSGWKSPKLSTLGVHPNGIANEINHFGVDFDPPADLAKIAEAAGGAYAQTIKNPAELRDALNYGMNLVKEGRTVVLDVHIPHV
ncbi:thiamine pyrophosphate-dependent enzyme, possible carboligase or decarboxylase [Schinkia azotoformans MEV2011]|uniref:Thiamine pyrophosphate-dependent enzyme, possible carboligase or decarboxylase n=1 Tax=Schinkia azotoformans MEV2011 TaxID=1348973 RepID=A0A072NIA7_SCHAZ|nr:thiamine pyrophosphate-requiring protein [Schinkia azotoformans]KEF36987.1 thiamine pyrophosphate-dependent enzyme, possible carboligase or decarboxylase [Schinkia azotoformans MEV2011]MEC1694416.1 thiamine pyrophosphate-requiring protein [Schinkia azotoformans]MEC1723227.1 thiamine pyrophosphate-requiring protein [Schinkia azotoformans]MEC1772156.1 thiamine pyrophosphate-requiring protein [Schinkia azotoformans]MEC1779152.1 thiamine pyrophosphate-requiring protein [Schinkia azotoformans]